MTLHRAESELAPGADMDTDMDEAAEDDLAASKLPSEPSVEDAVVAVANPDSFFHDVCVINYSILAFRLALGGQNNFP